MAQSQPPADPSQEKRLNAILVEYLKRKDAGQAVSEAALLQAYPDLADGLRSYFQGEAMMGGVAVAETVQPRPIPQSMASNVRETLKPGGGATDTSSEFRARSFGRYKLLRPLGEGAMGSVYLAQDTALDRQVALKVPKISGNDTNDFMARFGREAKAAAGLKHNHICSVYDVGEYDGVPYITMDFIDGVPLSRFVGSKKLSSIDSILQMILTIADAVSHAHSKGVIHRDLKPGNILIDAEFRPHVTDFGLARRIDPGNESRATQEGVLLGTPAYMAPEQVKGEQSKVGPASDVYSLGVMLFELLTSRLPFEGSGLEMLAQVLRDNPPIPSRLRKDLTEDVDDVCLKMLGKDPERRYASMAEVTQAITALREKLKRAPQNTADTARQRSPQNTADTARQRSPYEIQKAHIEVMLKQGQYAAAILDLEKLAKEKSPGAREVGEWARKTLPGVKAEAKALNPAGLEALFSTARQLFDKHDYPGCIQLLDDIPSLRRNEKMEDLLEKARSREVECEQLLIDIKEMERRQDLSDIEKPLRRLLKLKPGSSYAKRLMEALQTYSKSPASRRVYRFEKGRLQPMPEPGFLKQWALLGSLLGVLVFLSVYAYVVFYLKSDDQTIAVHVDNEWLNGNGDELTLPVDGAERQSKESSLADAKKLNQADTEVSPTNAGQRQLAEAQRLSVPVQVVNSIGMKLALIPDGDFVMGSPDGETGRSDSEGPQQQVRISKPFYMGVTEVTQGQWFKLMKTRPGQGTEYVREGDDFPVVFVNLVDVAAYCEKLSEREGVKYRLPTEAEWEYGCRAGTSTAYSFGSDPSELTEYGWFGGLEGDGNAKTELYAHAVQMKKPNAFGLHDMHGNVFEWCQDVYDEKAYGLRSGTTLDPLSLSGSEYHVLRGGSWYCGSGGARAAYRFHCPPATQNYGNGFRVARDVATIPIGDTAGESRTFSECDISLRWCPPGTFNLGSSQASMERLEDQDDTSGPGGNTVTIEFHRGFWIQESEVTQGLWQKVMNSQPWEADKDVPAGSDFPATFVSWEDSLDFCRTLTEQERTAGTLPSGFEYRLPTEAEWEYACRAGTNTRYYFGDDQSVLSEHAWWAENLQPNPMLQEVNQKPANAWGLRDVCGNVCEWCVDVYQDHLNSDGSPNTGDVTMNHVLRGGSFLSNHIFCMSATRYAFQGNVRANSLGLRIVLVPALAQKNVDNRPTTVLSETATNLQAPIQLSPKDGAFLGNRPQKNIMTWTPVAGATLYRVQIQFIVGANGELGPACDFESTTDRFENDLNGNRPKRWRVGTASGQTTAWSNWRQFKYRPLPVPPANQVMLRSIDTARIYAHGT